jgi:hypothetical protein
MQRLALNLTLGRTLLGGCRGGSGWHWHSGPPIGQRHELLVPRLIDSIEGVALRGDPLLQRFCEVLQQVKTIRHLDGRGRALARTLGIRARPIPGAHLHPGMLAEPLGDRLGGPLREQGHGLPALQVHQYCARGVPFP